MNIPSDPNSNQASGALSRIALNLGISRGPGHGPGPGPGPGPGGRGGATPYRNGVGFRSGENLARRNRDTANERVRNLVLERAPRNYRQEPGGPYHPTCCNPASHKHDHDHDHDPRGWNDIHHPPHPPHDHQGGGPFAPGPGMPGVSPASLVPAGGMGMGMGMGMPSDINPGYIDAQSLISRPGLPPGMPNGPYNLPPRRSNRFHGPGGWYPDGGDEEDDEFSGMFNFDDDEGLPMGDGSHPHFHGWPEWPPYDAPYDNYPAIPLMPHFQPGGGSPATSFIRPRPPHFGQRR